MADKPRRSAEAVRRARARYRLWRLRHLDQRRATFAAWSARPAVREHRREYARAYYARNKQRFLEKGRSDRYGISPAQFDRLKEMQHGVCAICASPSRGKRKELNVDHCHRSGVVRGLLCVNCNRLIGNALDDPVILAKAIDYLLRTKLAGAA